MLKVIQMSHTEQVEATAQLYSCVPKEQPLACGEESLLEELPPTSGER